MIFNDNLEIEIIKIDNMDRKTHIQNLKSINLIKVFKSWKSNIKSLEMLIEYSINT